MARRTLRFRVRARLSKEAGMNLVEILIALAIFSIGILQVLAMFPTAVISGADAVRATHAAILGRTAMAELEYQLRTPLFIGTVDSRTGTRIEVQDTPTNWPTDVWNNWPTDLWRGHFVTLTNRLDADNRIQCCYISGNGTDTGDVKYLDYSGSFTRAPQLDDLFRINRYALPSVPLSAPTRVCEAGPVDSANKNQLVVKNGDWLDPFKTKWAPATDRYFIIMTSGRATRKVYVVTDMETSKLVCDTSVDFLADGVVAGDAFFVAGCPDFARWQPNPNFGVPKPATTPALYYQTSAAPYFRELTDYRSIFTTATLISDVSDPSSPGEDLVRVDVLVFYRYDDKVVPEKNLRAIAHYVRYMGRR